MPGATDRSKIESYVYANFCARQVHNNFYENCCYLQLNVALAWVAHSLRAGPTTPNVTILKRSKKRKAYRATAATHWLPSWELELQLQLEQKPAPAVPLPAAAATALALALALGSVWVGSGPFVWR